VAAEREVERMNLPQQLKVHLPQPAPLLPEQHLPKLRKKVEKVEKAEKVEKVEKVINTLNVAFY
jgi:hypothetical protein